ncbi:hypothetical protein CXG81DRAFT_20087 [Caulochytrium protostelioides]|uniref:Uncharacterized protein n=1 Tax=Caulochytrium protostelioides TaxID=1555241 RepID=A0A4P9X483_9FUNG|nr:hypothetical protein CXG81DRAFT_20087 [Caulochytrium protostelioides]|eukprot:RKO99875.1 hypothetical protein CXG81DRAFT_20087 [Caulochytrium protostelioides]
MATQSSPAPQARRSTGGPSSKFKSDPADPRPSAPRHRRFLGLAASAAAAASPPSPSPSAVCAAARDVPRSRPSSPLPPPPTWIAHHAQLWAHRHCHDVGPDYHHYVQRVSSDAETWRRLVPGDGRGGVAGLEAPQDPLQRVSDRMRRQQQRAAALIQQKADALPLDLSRHTPQQRRAIARAMQYDAHRRAETLGLSPHAAPGALALVFKGASESRLGSQSSLSSGMLSDSEALASMLSFPMASEADLAAATARPDLATSQSAAGDVAVRTAAQPGRRSHPHDGHDGLSDASASEDDDSDADDTEAIRRRASRESALQRYPLDMSEEAVMEELLRSESALNAAPAGGSLAARYRRFLPQPSARAARCPAASTAPASASTSTAAPSPRDVTSASSSASSASSAASPLAPATPVGASMPTPASTSLATPAAATLAATGAAAPSAGPATPAVATALRSADRTRIGGAVDPMADALHTYEAILAPLDLWGDLPSDPRTSSMLAQAYAVMENSAQQCLAMFGPLGATGEAPPEPAPTRSDAQAAAAAAAADASVLTTPTAEINESQVQLASRQSTPGPPLMVATKGLASATSPASPSHPKPGSLTTTTGPLAAKAAGSSADERAVQVEKLLGDFVRNMNGQGITEPRKPRYLDVPVPPKLLCDLNAGRAGHGPPTAVAAPDRERSMGTLVAALSGDSLRHALASTTLTDVPSKASIPVAVAAATIPGLKARGGAGGGHGHGHGHDHGSVIGPRPSATFAWANQHVKTVGTQRAPGHRTNYGAWYLKPDEWSQYYAERQQTQQQVPALALSAMQAIVARGAPASASASRRAADAVTAAPSARTPVLMPSAALGAHNDRRRRIEDHISAVRQQQQQDDAAIAQGRIPTTLLFGESGGGVGGVGGGGDTGTNKLTSAQPTSAHPYGSAGREGTHASMPMSGSLLHSRRASLRYGSASTSGRRSVTASRRDSMLPPGSGAGLSSLASRRASMTPKQRRRTSVGAESRGAARPASHGLVHDWDDDDDRDDDIDEEDENEVEEDRDEEKDPMGMDRDDPSPASTDYVPTARSSLAGRRLVS